MVTALRSEEVETPKFRIMWHFDFAPSVVACPEHAKGLGASGYLRTSSYSESLLHRFIGSEWIISNVVCRPLCSIKTKR